MTSNEPDSEGGGTGLRTRPLNENPALAARAASLLRTPLAMVQLLPEEARCVVGYMRLVSYPRGAMLLRQGDDSSLNYMLLLIEGEVTIDNGEASPPDAVAVASVGPGSIVGEMSLLDGAPRSASCTAVSAVQAAGLSRRGLELLIDEHPRIAAKLMVGLAQRIADRLRARVQQLQIYADMNASLQQELNALRAPRPR